MTSTAPTNLAREKRYRRILFVLGSLSAAGYLFLSWLSGQFTSAVPDRDKPTIVMLIVFGLLFICYWAALKVVVALPPSKRLLLGTVAGACIFRGILLPSMPFHEIDIHRYIWDGAVSLEGVSPYRYSPEQVRLAAQHSSVVQEEQLQQLVVLQDRSAALSASLNQIHYGEFTSPYPSVSQAVFAVVALMTPEEVGTHGRVILMKLVLVLFDIGSMVVVIALLYQLKLHPGLNITYGWCPLVLKEFSNSGHLDSIAIFFTTLAVFLFVKCAKENFSLCKFALFGAFIALACGIAAKLYPVVLVPLFFAIVWRQASLRLASVSLLLTAIVSVVLLWPMIIHSNPSNLDPTEQGQVEAAPTLEDIERDLSMNAPPGLQAFLKQWEMNDLVFMIVLENFRPQTNIADEHRPWFVVMPEAWAVWINTKVTRLRHTMFIEDSLAINEEDDQDATAFLLARVLTLGTFGIIACWIAWYAARSEDPQLWCRAAMLTLAWFWFTSPTQNPWYWCWVMPFLPFARYRTWYLVACCTMLYYLRFWLAAHYPEPPVWGTRYDGEYFYYYVVVWFEFVPIFILLGYEFFLFKKTKKTVFE